MTAVETFKALLLLVLAAGAYAGLRLLQVRFKPEPELVRKLFHISGGVLALSLPWLFDRMTPVLVLGAVVAAALVALRVVPKLRSGFGQVLFGVERQTIGELCYLASICLLFGLAGNDKLRIEREISEAAQRAAFMRDLLRSLGKPVATAA